MVPKSHRRIFSLAAILLVAVISIIPASASGVQYQVFATGDHIAVQSDVMWVSGDSNASTGINPPVSGELLVGAYGTRVLAGGSYQTAGVFDTTNAIGYQYQTQADIDGVFRESIMQENYRQGMTLEECNNEPTGCSETNLTTYMSQAAFNARGMGALLIDSEGATSQMVIPGTLYGGAFFRGSGMASTMFSSLNSYSIGGDTDYGFHSEAKYRTITDGRNVTLDARYGWTSFQPSYPSESCIPEETG